MGLLKKANVCSLKISSFWRVSDNPKNPKISTPKNSMSILNSTEKTEWKPRNKNLKEKQHTRWITEMQKFHRFSNQCTKKTILIKLLWIISIQTLLGINVTC